MPITELFPIQSAYVSQFYNNQSFTSPANLFFGQYQGIGDIYRSLIQFPLHSIPFGSIVNSAQLALTISRNELLAGTIINAGLQYALVPWSQLSVTWNNQPSFNLTNTFTVSSANTPGSVISIDVSSIVNKWVNGLVHNDGFVITGNEQLNSLLGIANSGLVTMPEEHLPFEHLCFEEQHRDKHHHRHHRRDDDHCCRHHHNRCISHHHHHDLDDLDDLIDHRRIIREEIGTSIAVQNPPGSLHFVVVQPVSSNGPKLIINYS